MAEEFKKLLEEGKRDINEKYASRINRLFKRANFEIDFLLDHILNEPVAISLPMKGGSCGSTYENWKVGLKEACSRGQNYIEIFLKHHVYTQFNQSEVDFFSKNLENSGYEDRINIGTGNYKIYDQNVGWKTFENGPNIVSEIKRRIGDDFKVKFNKNNSIKIGV